MSSGLPAKKHLIADGLSRSPVFSPPENNEEVTLKGSTATANLYAIFNAKMETELQELYHAAASDT